jgi:hypothetical protein
MISEPIAAGMLSRVPGLFINAITVCVRRRVPSSALVPT